MTLDTGPKNKGPSATAAPMIEVERLTKRFAATTAVEGLTFSVGRGEVVGLLGPNGAGKSTTMRMLTTYLPPTSGRARLAGHDALEEPVQVRRHIGYLPESVPLYPEMRVREYLAFRARLKDLPRSARRAAIDQALERCGLEEAESRIVGQLSRGFRQRVGLADALLNDPEILILDEPTAGLDPLQIREVRSLIRELGQRHTILLSTHILQEVEAVCGRVIVIARGRLALDERLDRLQAGSESEIEVEVRAPADAFRRAIETMPGVARVAVAEGTEAWLAARVWSRDGVDLREAVADRIFRNQWPLRRLERRRSSLEEQFVRAVGAADLASASAQETGIGAA